MTFSKKQVIGKLKSIEYRGPDNTGYNKIGDVTMGHLRLSILDLESRSNQPFTSGKFHIVFNGEIYNYLDIRKELIEQGYSFTTSSDTEVLLIGYKVWGKNVLERINGMFAFCIYDEEEEIIFCSRDRLGVKPFYYYWNDGEFEICSQIKPINEDKKLNDEAIGIYLDCGYVPSPYSMFMDVYKLPPGCNMVIDLKNGSKEIHEYWNIKKVTPSTLSYEEAKAKLHELIIDSVKIRLQSDVPIGTFLSGGVDSALVSAIAAKISDKVNTFSIGFEEKEYDESAIAEQYAEIIQSNHKTTICSADDSLKLMPMFTKVYDEPFADSSAIPSLLLNSITTNYVTVALSGDGGDESFLGYNYLDRINKDIWLFNIPRLIRLLLPTGIISKVLNKNPRALKEIMKLKDKYAFIESVFINFDSLNVTANRKWFKNFSYYKSLSRQFLQNAADLNIKLWLENDSNVKVDRASMAYSVEVRSPFLDYRIIEFARSLPIDYRFLKGRKKRIIRDILKEYIPEEIFNQPKKGFSIPLAHWLKHELKEDVIRVLNPDFLDKVPNLDVEKLNRQLHNHLNGISEHTSNIWRIYVFGKWCEEYGFLTSSNKS